VKTPDNITASVTHPVAALESVSESDYNTPPEVLAGIIDAANEHPDIVEILLAGRTYQGRQIYIVKVSDNVHDDEDEPRVLLQHGIHAREVITWEIALDTVKYLAGNYESDNMVTAWVDGLEIYIIPTYNVDGITYAFNTYSMQRKNMRGVDLNRNYDCNWTGGGSTNPGNETYRGPYPGSEAEIQALAAFAFHKRFDWVVDYHSYGNYFMVPPIMSSEDEVTVSNLLYDCMPPTPMHNITYLGYYGQSSNYYYHELGALSFLPEIGTEFWPPAGNIRNMVEDYRPIWQMLLDRAIGSYVYGMITDNESGEPLPALVEVSDTHGTTARGSGFYVKLMDAGSWTIDYSAPGYVSQARVVDAASAPVRRDVALVRQSGENRPPRASFTASAMEIPADTEVLFNASESYDPDGDEVTCTWTFGDGDRHDPAFQHTGVVIPFTFALDPGTYMIELTVIDLYGLEDKAVRTIVVR
jgi:hypothetical protein